VTLNSFEEQSDQPLDEAALDAIDEGEDDIADGRVHDSDEVRDRILMAASGINPDE
jgi:predicted transcriptional regulator